MLRKDPVDAWGLYPYSLETDMLKMVIRAGNIPYKLTNLAIRTACSLDDLFMSGLIFSMIKARFGNCNWNEFILDPGWLSAVQASLTPIRSSNGGWTFNFLVASSICLRAERAWRSALVSARLTRHRLVSMASWQAMMTVTNMDNQMECIWVWSSSGSWYPLSLR